LSQKEEKEEDEEKEGMSQFLGMMGGGRGWSVPLEV
jgi:hypothetical protein